MNEIEQLKKEIYVMSQLMADDGFPECRKCGSYAVELGNPPKHSYDEEHGGTPEITCFRCAMCGEEWAD